MSEVLFGLFLGHSAAQLAAWIAFVFAAIPVEGAGIPRRYSDEPWTFEEFYK